MIYLKLFNDHNDYETYITENPDILPNMSLCTDSNHGHYNSEPDYFQLYLTISSLENNNVISFKAIDSSATTKTISISTDNGLTWTQKTSSDSGDGTILATLNKGEKLLIKGSESAYSTSTTNYNLFKSTKKFNIYGNIMSLIFGDNFVSQRPLLTAQYTFSYLFKDSLVINAENLILPVASLTTACYRDMFYNCSNLQTAPKLPATTLATYCYCEMFHSCSSLSTPPDLPALTLIGYCYNGMFRNSGITRVPIVSATSLGTGSAQMRYMFYNCQRITQPLQLPYTSLTSYCYESMYTNCSNLEVAPELPARHLATYCYQYMFYGCTNLVEAPELPATTLLGSCYKQMFKGCSSLREAPELPATTLSNSCYLEMFMNCTNLGGHPVMAGKTLASNCCQSMFQNCTSLTLSPKLVATRLEANCYNSMFYGCSHLEEAPNLPATVLVEGCYSNMFKNCSLITSISAMFTTTPGPTYTENWVSGVSARGNFIKNANASWDVSGVNGIPSGWSITMGLP